MDDRLPERLVRPYLILHAPEKQTSFRHGLHYPEILHVYPFQEVDRIPKDLWTRPGIGMFRSGELEALLARFPMDLAYGSPELERLKAKLHEFHVRELELFAASDVDGVQFMDD